MNEATSAKIIAESERLFFNENGFLILRNAVPADLLSSIKMLAQKHYQQPSQPWELEATLGYPGAPSSEVCEGGDTPRRLRGAYAREAEWRAFATSPLIKGALKQIFNSTKLFLSQAHHNCLMTKSPSYSSDTGWHQDSRYWRFEKPDLVTAWLPLGREYKNNGGLQLVPGSHLLDFDGGQFDEKIFFKPGLPLNQRVLEKSIDIELEPGDLLFFHCQLLHRASRNYEGETKLSLVFTYHSEGNSPLEGTRSASQEEIIF